MVGENNLHDRPYAYVRWIDEQLGTWAYITKNFGNFCEKTLTVQDLSSRIAYNLISLKAVKGKSTFEETDQRVAVW